MYCAWKIRSFARQSQWLPGTSSIWRALTGELKSLLSQQHKHGSLRGTAVCWPTLPLKHYAPWQHWPLCSLNLSVLWREWPGSHKSLVMGWIEPQFHSDFNTDGGNLHQNHMALQVRYWTTDMSLVPCQLLSYLQFCGVQHTVSWSLQLLKAAEWAARIQTACGLILYPNALLWSQIAHRNMFAPGCKPNLWNEFICRSLWDWFLIEEKVPENNTLPSAPFSASSGAFCSIFCIEASTKYVDKQFNKTQSIRSHCLGFRVGSKAAHPNS